MKSDRAYSVSEETLARLKEKLRQKEGENAFAEHPEILPPLAQALKANSDLNVLIEEMIQAWKRLHRSFEGGGSLFLCGNGGSMADAQHIAGELAKSFRRPRPLGEKGGERFAGSPKKAALGEGLQRGLPVLALGTNSALVSAISNDQGYEFSFAQELYALGKRGDVLMGISTSGNSRNVVNAALTAEELEMETLALTGKGGGELARIVDLALSVPARETGEVQQLHETIYHGLCGMIEETWFGDD